jgi:hypothetical protein
MKSIVRRSYQEFTLVPLADMLTNVVGIAIFILIFTVLAAGGAVVAKRLPFERTTKAQPVDFLCAAGRIYPLNDELIKRLVDRVGQPSASGDIERWARHFDGQRIESPDVAVTSKAGMVEHKLQGFTLHTLEATVTYQPVPGGGETAVDAGGPQSRLRAQLASLDRKKFFVRFAVSPDGIDAFNVARAQAESLGFQSGWSPADATAGVTFSLTGQGGDGRIL